MDVKKIIQENTVLSLSTVIISSFLAGIALMTFLDNRDDKLFDKVYKGTYKYNEEINQKFIPKEKYDQAQKQIEELNGIVSDYEDKPDLPGRATKFIRKVEVFKGDTLDYYGISIGISRNIDELKEIRKFLKNNGFQNTEIFKSEDNRFYVISYGYAWIGSGIKKAKSEIEKSIKELGVENVEIINLTTIAPNGFTEHIEKSIFLYYKPKT